MKLRSYFILLFAAVLIPTLKLNAQVIHPTLPHADQASKKQGLTPYLNPDGSLNETMLTSSSIDVRGYRMQLGAGGVPHFFKDPSNSFDDPVAHSVPLDPLPASVSAYWDTTLANGNNLHGSAVLTMAVDSDNLYI